MKGYMDSIAEFKRRITVEVVVGNTPLGGGNPIRVQTMTTTDTNNTTATVEQCIRAIEAGAELVRITTQGTREAANLQSIKQELMARGYKTPIVADVHFNPAAALEAAKHVEKVRINPGNYADPRAKFVDVTYTDEEYSAELDRIEQKLLPLIELCKDRNVAIRVGVNHGSLSDRIMSRYGDTPAGMVESAMEFLRIFRKHNFNSLVISMKSSNTRVMVQAVRLLVATMNAEGMSYPLHLGVTEAGDGEDGRIKSAVGIGALLSDGIGDTIRVSLTEEPENEIPVAKKLVAYFINRQTLPALNLTEDLPYNPYEYNRRETIDVKGIGGANPPRVFAYIDGTFTEATANAWGWHFNSDKKEWQSADIAPDFFVIPGLNDNSNLDGLPIISEHTSNFRLLKVDEYIRQKPSECVLLDVTYADLLNQSLLSALKENPKAVLLLSTKNSNGFAEQRAAVIELMRHGIQSPMVVVRDYADTDKEDFQLKAAADLGGLLIDGLVDGILIRTSAHTPEVVRNTAFAILQAARTRITKTEYIACPGCGRTLFSLQQTLHKVRSATSHLKGLKIGVMGCIVNGPGEMADADYGYVGAGPGRITLYKGKEVVKKNIPEDQAIDELIALIKANGDWADR
ncbi:MAG: (E)-4-hydroxy-3-methylbut-2-enyl-diphosphate synthase [Bacteroidota bacterium]